MKKFTLNIILSLLFVCICAAFILSFAADRQFSEGRRLADSYLWDEAAQKFGQAIILDPFNASYAAGLADFLKSISPYRPATGPLLKKTIEWYTRALKLDPLNAEYALSLGETELMIFVRDKEKDKAFLSKALNHFNQALKNDSNGFNVAYSIGYRLMGIWPALNEKDKSLCLDRLKLALEQQPWFWVHIYPLAWLNTNDFSVLQQIAPLTLDGQKDLLYFLESNDLYQFRQQQAQVVEKYRKTQDPIAYEQEKRTKMQEIEKLKNEYRNTKKLMEINGDILSPSDWYGKASYSDDEFKDGAMYWTGTMSAVINMPQDSATLVVQAKGSPADGGYPYMIVEVDGEEVVGTFVKNEGWKEYTFPVKTTGGAKVLSITFLNDGGNPEKKEDRNLYIGETRVEVQK